LGEEAYAPLAARYLETRSDGHAPPRSKEWQFTRNGGQVEFAYGASYVELWLRDTRGGVSWQRIFHDDRKLIAYTPGELRTQGRAVAWETLNTIVDVGHLLADLKATGATQHLDRPAMRYTGTVKGQDVEVIWLDKERLPARITRRDRMHIYYHLALQEILSVPQGSLPASDPTRTADYEEIDGADLGDREYDPFVQKVLAMDGHNHRH
jgi:hypothetical protein